MPLAKGRSDKTVSDNIAELIRHGHKPNQAIAIAYDKAGRGRKEVKAVKQVLVRQKLLRGGNRLLRANVVGTNDNGSLRCMFEGALKPTDVQPTDTIPASQVYGPGREPAVIQKLHPTSPFSLANRLQNF